MIKVNVLVDENSWSKRLDKKEKFFNKICKLFPGRFRYNNKKVYLTVLLSNNKRIKNLNKKFRNKDKHTDILSFPFDQKLKKQKEIYLGDIIISFEHINKPQRINVHEFKHKVTKSFIHGYLHLIGYDHKKDKEYKKMLKEEEKIYQKVISKLK